MSLFLKILLLAILLTCSKAFLHSHHLLFLFFISIELVRLPQNVHFNSTDQLHLEGMQSLQKTSWFNVITSCYIESSQSYTFHLLLDLAGIAREQKLNGTSPGVEHICHLPNTTMYCHLGDISYVHTNSHERSKGMKIDDHQTFQWSWQWELTQFSRFNKWYITVINSVGKQSWLQYHSSLRFMWGNSCSKIPAMSPSPTDIFPLLTSCPVSLLFPFFLTCWRLRRMVTHAQEEHGSVEA